MEGHALTEAAVGDLAKFIDERKGEGVVALDLRELGSWTDFFVIATVTSSAHLRGLARFIPEWLRERGLPDFRRPGYSESDEWNLIDCGDFVVHLMSARAREFYELERLWYQAKILFDARKPASGS